MAKDTVKKNPVIIVAEEQEQSDNIFTTKSGVRLRFKQYNKQLIVAAVNKIELPKVPRWHNEKKNRWEDNPNDPGYIAAVEDATRRQNLAAMDAMLLFGVELVDGLPKDNSWYIEMQLAGIVDKDYNDLSEIEKGFFYRKYIMDDHAWVELSKASSISESGVELQEGMFRNN